MIMKVRSNELYKIFFSMALISKSVSKDFGGRSYPISTWKFNKFNKVILNIFTII